VEEWNNGSLRHPISFDPIFQHSIIPIFLSSSTPTQDTPADFRLLKFDPRLAGSSTGSQGPVYTISIKFTMEVRR
jgi:hypothetical protein